MATDTMSLVEQCQEILRRTSGQASTTLATLMLACQMNVVNAQTAPVSPADSAIATAAKGYWQEVTLKDGSKMNFADIAKMGTKEQDTVIDGMDEKEISRFEQYIRESKLKVANQDEKKIDEKIEAANQETIQLRIANVAKLKLLAEKNWWKLSKSDEKYLKNIVADGKPPIDEAKYILSKATFP